MASCLARMDGADGGSAYGSVVGKVNLSLSLLGMIGTALTVETPASVNSPHVS